MTDPLAPTPEEQDMAACNYLTRERKAERLVAEARKLVELAQELAVSDRATRQLGNVRKGLTGTLRDLRFSVRHLAREANEQPSLLDLVGGAGE